MQPQRVLSQSKVSFLVSLAALSLFAWSPSVLAHAKGVIGYGYLDHGPPPRGFDEFCKYRVPFSCFCKWSNNTSFNTVDGCSNVSKEMAEKEAVNTCTTLCMRSLKETGGGFGSTVVRPGASTGMDVSLEGAGTLFSAANTIPVGVVPFSEELIDGSAGQQQLAQELVDRTTVPWVWLEGQVNWGDSNGAEAFVQAVWSRNGQPRPLGRCDHSVQLACPLEDVGLGDRVYACSAQSEHDAYHVARTSCAPLRYNALSHTWSTWAIVGAPDDGGPPRIPSATILAVAPQRFLGFVPSTLEVLGPVEDWSTLADELLERTQGNALWLAGPSEFYAPQP